jgi:YVTN family beta-propeller protein
MGDNTRRYEVSRRRAALNFLIVSGLVSILVIGCFPGGGGGIGDTSVSFTPSTFIAYTNNLNDATISVVEYSGSTNTSTVVDTFPKGGNGAGGIVKIGPKLYAVNADSNTVSVIDTTTNTVNTTIPVGNNPLGIARNPVNNELYVANRDDDTVSVIDTTTDSVTATIAVGDGPYGLAVGQVSNTLYVANETTTTPGGGTVSVVDLDTRAVTATVAVGGAPHDIAAYGALVYVSNTAAGVSRIDTYRNTVAATGSITGTLQGIAVFGWVYVANQTAGAVLRIDPTSLDVEATIPVSASPNSPVDVIAVSDPHLMVGFYIVATNPDDDTVSIIQGDSIINTIPVGHGPYASFFEPVP